MLVQDIWSHIQDCFTARVTLNYTLWSQATYDTRLTSRQASDNDQSADMTDSIQDCFTARVNNSRDSASEAATNQQTWQTPPASHTSFTQHTQLHAVHLITTQLSP